MNVNKTGDAATWYRDAVIYQLHVKSFRDADGDGIGDFRGLTEKLDYLKDLGVTALWLLPFCPSPLKDDGYDISDYRGIHPSYGTLTQFKDFLRNAHRRGLKVITELVVNHTSDQHPWFQRARRAKRGSVHRDFYVWSDSPEKYSDARIIFQDFEPSNWTWDPVAGSYYWHRFYFHQPDLNFDNPRVQEAILRVMDFWFGLGVDGLRLDAVPYLFERENTNCENLPETHEFLKKLRAHVDARFENRMILGEANQWPEDAAAYFGEGDECHMAFHFPLMPRLFMALHMEDRFPVVDILDQTPSISETCQWAVFLRNHDELTLEMVTDEERDYMYRVYAREQRMRINLGIRRRLAPLLGNHRRRMELMNGLLLSLPGTPVIYYGDEIAMGDNVFLGDRDGVRTPMQWSPDRNAGFSAANPQTLFLPVIIDPEYHYEVVNVESRLNNRYSFLWWMKRIIALRRRFKSFGRGDIHFLEPRNRHILAFIRSLENEKILVTANLSRFTQHVELDLSEYQGSVPVEVFGGAGFPEITSRPYALTMGPHSFYWFSLTGGEGRESITISDSGDIPELEPAGTWKTFLEGECGEDFSVVLSRYLPGCRWFGGKARTIKRTRVSEAFPMTVKDFQGFLLFADVFYMTGESERYVVAVGYASGEKARGILEDRRAAVIARLKGKVPGEQVIYEASSDGDFFSWLFNLVLQRGRRRGGSGILSGFPAGTGTGGKDMEAFSGPSFMGVEQSNTSAIFGEKFVLKLVRKLEDDVNPELEIGRFLTGKHFASSPPVKGAVEYRPGKHPPVTVAVVHGFVPNLGDAWQHALDHLGRYYENMLAERPEKPDLMGVSLENAAFLREAEIFVGEYLESAKLIGLRTAELHKTLASDHAARDFSPEPFSILYQRSLYQSLRSLIVQTLKLLKDREQFFATPVSESAAQVTAAENKLLQVARRVVGRKIEAVRIRCHGDYHLGQVLYTGKDFVIIDFEGEPARPVSERRIKRSPLRDVAGMLRSFDYAAHVALLKWRERGVVSDGDYAYLESWARYWSRSAGTAFLCSYTASTEGTRLLPPDSTRLKDLLDFYVLDKAVYELGYEMNNRPDWVGIPIRAIIEIIEESGKD
ncbi:MAG TPA: maltose alpha-D-glucosyltransferase [Desulfobacteraceae bacterium]|nr:maltose alpha-D-glucosyltransferase [Desulfobacteraceae bacterium]